MELSINQCPACGSRRVHKTRKDVHGERGGRPYTVPDVEFFECPECGEKVYDRDAIRKIETGSGIQQTT